MSTTSGQVIQMPSRGASALITKQQLAMRLGRSARWIEMQTREKGLPALQRTDRRGRRLYDLDAVLAWMGSGKPKERPATEHERISTLEMKVASLQAQLNDLRRTA